MTEMHSPDPARKTVSLAYVLGSLDDLQNNSRDRISRETLTNILDIIVDASWKDDEFNHLFQDVFGRALETVSANTVARDGTDSLSISFDATANQAVDLLYFGVKLEEIRIGKGGKRISQLPVEVTELRKEGREKYSETFRIFCDAIIDMLDDNQPIQADVFKDSINQLKNLGELHLAASLFRESAKQLIRAKLISDPESNEEEEEPSTTFPQETLDSRLEQVVEILKLACFAERKARTLGPRELS